MKEQRIISQSPGGISDEHLLQAVGQSLDEVASLSRVLLIVPDYTRRNSKAGLLACGYYRRLSPTCRVDVLEALGTHAPMTREECAEMYPDIPFQRFIPHNWRRDTVKVGQVPAHYVDQVSDHLYSQEIDVEINRLLLEAGYDLILSVGSIVPHAVVGLSGHSKNLFVGIGGVSMISGTHLMGAFYGMERILGRRDTPVRRIFDYALDHCLPSLPIWHVMTVSGNDQQQLTTYGLFISPGREAFEEASRLSQEKSIQFVPRPFQRVVVSLDAREYKSTWVGNKAIHRVKTAMAPCGELVILAPGVSRFGEDEGMDRLIRRYGYCGRQRVRQLCSCSAELRENLAAAAHLIHGSTEGRFRVTYCTDLLSAAEVNRVGYRHASYIQMARKYRPETLRDGEQQIEDGEPFFYISNPSLGLWIARSSWDGPTL